MAAIASSNSRLHESPTWGNENVNKTDLITRCFATSLAVKVMVKILCLVNRRTVSQHTGIETQNQKDQL